MRKEVVRVDREEYLTSLGLSEAEIKLCTLLPEEVEFVCAMVNEGCDKYRAYKKVAGLKEEDALSEGQYKAINKLLNNEEVRQIIRLGIQKKMSESLDNLDNRLLQTYIQRAFYDPSLFVLDNGDPRELSEIPKELRCVVDGVEKKFYGKDADAYTITYKLANRDTALKVLGEYMQMIRPSVATSVQITNVMTASTDKVKEEIQNMSDEELRLIAQGARDAV